MRIGAILRRWIEILAALYLAWRESRRELRSLVVTRENGHVVVRHAEPARDAMLRDAQAGNVIATLPPGAEVSADVSRAASAQLQSNLAQLADDQRASLVSSGGEASKRDNAPDTIRLQATLDMNLKALRAFLYQLESGTPYVFVDALTVQPAGAMAGRAVEDPLLRTTLSLRAFWRRGTP